MIGAQQVVDIALDAAARLGGAGETIVLVRDRVATSLRWANNSMTTNGVSTARNTTVISIVRQGDTARVGTLTSADVSVPPRAASPCRTIEITVVPRAVDRPLVVIELFAHRSDVETRSPTNTMVSSAPPSRAAASNATSMTCCAPITGPPRRGC